VNPQLEGFAVKSLQPVTAVEKTLHGIIYKLGERKPGFVV
jgi:hypothetical protein